MFFGAPLTAEKENCRQCDESDEKEYLYFFKTSKIENSKKLCYICECDGYFRDIEPCIYERYREKEHRKCSL